MIRRTRIKFCGMTRVVDAQHAAALGVDAIGLVFTAHSPRCVDVEQARVIRDSLPPFVTSVALFMDDDEALVRRVVNTVAPDCLQFHGAETDAWCARFGRPFLKAVAMGSVAAGLKQLREYPHAAALLLDGHGVGEAGGSGRVFDWSRIPSSLAQPLMLAGGLHAGNVAAAIVEAHPWAVDVSGGIESAPGIKDAVMMERFVAAVREIDTSHERHD